MSRYHNHFQWLSGLLNVALCAVFCLLAFLDTQRHSVGFSFLWLAWRKSFTPPSESKRILSGFPTKGFLLLACSLCCNISKNKVHLTLIPRKSLCCTTTPASKDWGEKKEAKLAKGITWKNWTYSLAALHLQRIPTKMPLFLEGSIRLRKPAWSPASHSRLINTCLFFFVSK